MIIRGGGTDFLCQNILSQSMMNSGCKDSILRFVHHFEIHAETKRVLGIGVPNGVPGTDRRAIGRVGLRHPKVFCGVARGRGFARINEDVADDGALEAVEECL